MEQIVKSAEQTNGNAQQKPKKAKPTRVLPTDRIQFSKQIALLRAYAAASGPTGKVVSNKEVADIVDLSDNTTSLANGFFVDVGLLQRADGGFLPCQEVISFGRAFEWNPENAAHKLAPVFQGSWFAQALLPKLNFSPMEEKEAVERLAEQANAGPDYKLQLRLLIDFLEEAGIVRRDDGQLKLVRSVAHAAPPQSQTQEKPHSPSAEARETPPTKTAVSTTYLQPTEGVVQFHVSVRVDMKEFSGWDPTRITAFFGGIAQVLAAKGAIEKGGVEEE